LGICPPFLVLLALTTSFCALITYNESVYAAAQQRNLNGAPMLGDHPEHAEQARHRVIVPGLLQTSVVVEEKSINI
jgi:hypothetical protein